MQAKVPAAVIPAKSGYPVVTARERSLTARYTGSSAFADDDIGIWTGISRLASTPMVR